MLATFLARYYLILIYSIFAIVQTMLVTLLVGFYINLNNLSFAVT